MREDDIDTFLAARWSSLFRLACLLTGSPAEADDLLQESLVKVYLRWTKISRTQVPEAYVRRMMVNTLVSRSRRPYKRRELLEGTVTAGAVGSSEDVVLDRAQVWPLVCALPVRQRAVIVLRYYEDMSESRDRRCARLLERERQVPGPRRADVVETRGRCAEERGRGDERVMITEPWLRDTLSRQAERYEVPPYDAMSLRAAAVRRRRGTNLRYAGMAAAALLAVGVAWGQLRAGEAEVQPADSHAPSDDTILPSCFPAGVTPPVPESPWARGGFLSDEPVTATTTAPDGRSCTLVLHYGFHRFAVGLSGMVWLYSDGRLIVDTATAKDWFVQWERRLTAEGVERLRTAVATMLDRSDSRSGRYFEAKIRYGDGTFYPKDSRALVRLLTDLSWLPDEKWVRETPSIYRAAWYLTCYEMRGADGVDVHAAVRDLPPGASEVLESLEWTALPPDAETGVVRSQCVVVSRADATVLAEALGGDIAAGKANVFPMGLDGAGRQFSVHALMPDGTSGEHGD